MIAAEGPRLKAGSSTAEGGVLSERVSLSIIMPVWREAQTIESTLSGLQSLRQAGHELLVVDGGSDDDTVQLARPLCDRVIGSAPGRAVQMNAGAAVATGNVLVFLHADTLLPENALNHLADFQRSDAAWGRFDVRLSGRRPLFRVISWFINRRSWLSGIATGDQAMFVRRSVFERLGGFAAIPLMEDVELSARLKRESRPFCISDPVTTDSRRWQKNGAWRTVFLMWRIRWRFWRGDSPESLAKLYRADVRREH
ncbi:TIGR04283 family arsenosugar biosynthesis glycosyltransferase [Marinobacter sp. CHS3-4]|uniref:TIGR04283 family arsenosugar biosynthesis glycosyltransferase n=1 Tax=Marinobacter sp. CHS3-4 TaxID=3045174 RepID=UPI0024B5D79C|nr:TIGR04283 family arsenosugar biosynthesis glycosyltransferase [Marinobacter sp. CHS3-4]MDI9245145.1 TIGR04283 family arsenosugar biosynthesis glycosyltransferase [Marinobacter sp. CHS3-4]